MHCREPIRQCRLPGSLRKQRPRHSTGHNPAARGCSSRCSCGHVLFDLLHFQLRENLVLLNCDARPCVCARVLCLPSARDCKPHPPHHPPLPANAVTPIYRAAQSGNGGENFEINSMKLNHEGIRRFDDSHIFATHRVASDLVACV